YVICEVSSKEEGDFYAVGYMPTARPGESASLTGDWVNHPEYGEQFKVELYETIMPKEETAIIKYLSSGVIKGVREATAKKLYEAFGDSVFDVLTNEPEKVEKIKGIGHDRAVTICKSFNEQRSVQNIVMFLQQYSISANTAIKIHKIFGSEAVSVIKENPYALANAVDGISFKTADAIAYNIGIPKNSPERIACGVVYYLREAAYTNGHAYLPRGVIKEHTVYNLDITETEAENAISELIADRDIILDKIDNNEVLYLYGMYHDEKYIANRVVEIATTESKYAISASRAEEEVDEFERDNGIKLAKKQREAVVTALSSGFMVLTGGPGTGKTTTINAIISIMENLNIKVALAAPTGRAAKRMSQVTGRDAKTVHRLLGAQMVGNTHTFSRDEENPLDCDVIILDEASMVDTSLMASFLRAVKPGGRIILSGDSDQLPSVGAGNVLRDIIASGVVSTVKLSDIFRQSEESLIIVNAHKINNGEMPELGDRTRDFFFMKRANPSDVATTVTELYKSRLPKTYGLNPMSDIQILSPTKKGITGTVELNRILQMSINPPSQSKNEYKYGQTVFREGDKVMQTRNNYDIEYTTENGEDGVGIYNGDMGIVDSIHTQERYMIITFDDGKIIEYPFTSVEDLDLAYAITVHKSQGSEFSYVVIPLSTYMPMLMTRNLFYTAITRAKTMVILVGSDRIVENMTKNNTYTKRFTGLLDRLIRQKERSSQ
ncbi:MAG: ATP-dependent RecD-like DNA helicase, partial [Clostridia bacterium]|nr:ATP-dependent RecD-like DNA helicase [Clostridia bacterium]